MTSDSKKLILHVGTEKTGTTSIQHALATNRERLRTEGFLFPRCLGLKNHTNLAAACLDDGVVDNIKAHLLAVKSQDEIGFRQSLHDALREELTSGVSWHTLIVSTELIHSRLTTPSEIHRLFDFFEPYVDTIEIVLCLRRQDDLAVSRFSSTLRAGHSGFDDVLQNIGDHYYPSKPDKRNVNDFEQYYDYQRLVERFEDFVEPSQIHISLYEDLSRKRAVVETFLKNAGIDYDSLVGSDSQLNPAMSADAQYVLSALNGFGKPWHPNGLRRKEFKALQTEIENRYSGERRQIARRDAQEFFERFSESNEWLRRRYFPERASLFDLDFSKYPDNVNYETLEDDLKADVAEYKNREAKLTVSRWPRITKLLATRERRATRKSLKIPKSADDTLSAKWLGRATRPYHMTRKISSFMRLPKADSSSSAEFALVRVLGSDHYPRHSENQTLNNLLFILENEPDFPDCNKFFVVNRIFDQKAEAEVISALEKHDADFVRIPFDPVQYAKMGWDTEPFGGDGFFSSKAFARLPERNAMMFRLFAAAPKIRYAMNVNGARNLALEKGASMARWVLALDGNCALTTEAYDLISKSAKSYPHVPYIVVPMLRLDSNDEYFSFGGSAATIEEPQIAIHRSAREKFDERFPYGFRDKAELFTRIGIPGPWEKWRSYFWLPPKIANSPDFLQFKLTTGTVLRLAAGMRSLEKTDNQSTRFGTRTASIFRTLAYLDDQNGSRDYRSETAIFGAVVGKDHEQLE